MISRKLFSALVTTVLFISCQKELHFDVVPVHLVPMKNTFNVPYGPDPMQIMDTWLPAGRSKTSTKVIVMIHGGGWNAGDKSDFAIYIDSLQKRLPDWAIININYRLATTSSTLFPAQENDVKTALTFLMANTDEYQITQKIVLLGASAGGHLALLQGYKYSSPIKPKAIISFFGPTDMRDMYLNPANPLVPAAIVSVMGATPTQDSLLYANSSPINYINASSPPTILLHGGADILVKSSQSAAVDAKLQTAGVVHQYVFYPTEGHGWVGVNLTDSFDKIQAFLAANVQ